MIASLIFDLPANSSVRFITLGLRDSDVSPYSASISAFGLLTPEHCKVAFDRENISYMPGVITFKMRNDVKMSGYYFTTSATHAEYDPVNWIVDVVDGITGNQTTVVGASSWSSTFYSGVSFDGQLPYPTPNKRNTDVEVYYPQVWSQIADCIVSAIYALCYLRIFYCGVTHQLDGIRTVSIASLFAHIFILVVLSLVFVGAQDYFHATITCLYCVQPIVFWAGILFYERHVLCVIYSYLMSVVVSSVTINYVRGYPLYTPAEAPAGIFRTGVLPGLLGLALIIQSLRHSVLTRARKLVLKDQEQYDKIWAALIANTESVAALNNLKELAEFVAVQSKGLLARHYNVCFEPDWHRTINTQFFVPVSGSSQSTAWSQFEQFNTCCSLRTVPVDSLDQLYCQATILNPILLEKVQDVALRTEGMFPLKNATSPSPVFCKYAVALCEPNILARMSWGKVKTVDRAVEKVVRSYSQVSVVRK